LITGLATPLGIGLSVDFMAYPRMLSFAQNFVGKVFVGVVIALFAWHAAHRIFHSLHDVGVHSGMVAKLLCYGSALGMTLVVIFSLLRMGF
jgi:fumarate reductase subunit D